jgi:type III secretory pathway component EscU
MQGGWLQLEILSENLRSIVFQNIFSLCKSIIKFLLKMNTNKIILYKFKLFLRTMIPTRAIHPNFSNWERLLRTHITYLVMKLFDYIFDYYSIDLNSCKKR